MLLYRFFFFPLHWAADCGYKYAVLLLLNSGADPTRVDIDGRTALDIALSLHHEDIFKLLKDSGSKELTECAKS